MHMEPVGDFLVKGFISAIAALFSIESLTAAGAIIAGHTHPPPFLYYSKRTMPVSTKRPRFTQAGPESGLQTGRPGFAEFPFRPGRRLVWEYC